MDTPQEVEVWFILPSLRKEYVNSFLDIGLKQNEIAKILNITESAVSQYKKNKRGNKTSYSNEILSLIKKSAMKIKTPNKFKQEFQRMLKTIKHTRMMCNICHDHIDAKNDCQICYS
jgi:uncharacterized protein